MLLIFGIGASKKNKELKRKREGVHNNSVHVLSFSAQIVDKPVLTGARK